MKVSNVNFRVFFLYKGRADVDKAVTQIPEQLRGNAEDIIGEKSNGTTVEVVCAESGKKESGISSGTEKNTTNEESSEDGEDNVPSKKLKTEGKRKKN